MDDALVTKSIFFASPVLGLWLSINAPSSPAAAGPEAPVPAPKQAAPKRTKAPASADAKARPTAEVTLTGQLTCAKCGLHESSTCQNVLRVKDAGATSETKYYLAMIEIAEAHHEEVCGGQVAATVTGSVREENGKKVLTASAITMP
jgi:hypothetical protein